MDWNIDTKVSTITLDNCTTNDAMIDKIKDKLHFGSLLRDGSDDAVPVFVKHTEAMLDEIDKIVSVFNNSSWFSFFGTTS